MILYKKKASKPEFNYCVHKITPNELVLSEYNFVSTYGFYAEMFYKFERTDCNHNSEITKLHGNWKLPDYDLHSIEYVDTLRFKREFDCSDPCQFLELTFTRNTYKPDVFKFSSYTSSAIEHVYSGGLTGSWIYNPLERSVVLVYNDHDVKTYKIIMINENEFIISLHKNE